MDFLNPIPPKFNSRGAHDCIYNKYIHVIMIKMVYGSYSWENSWENSCQCFVTQVIWAKGCPVVKTAKSIFSKTVLGEEKGCDVSSFI